jgi:hypothetical protein
MAPVSLSLYQGIVSDTDAPLGSVSPFLKTWRRTWRRIGGPFIGTVQISAEDVGLDWMDDFFEGGIGTELRETAAGEESWRGICAKIEYRRRNSVFVRDISKMVNASRTNYTVIFPDMLTNGSGESGAWVVYNGATVEQSNLYVTHGSYSVKIAVADAAIRGAIVQPTTFSISTGIDYTMRGTVHVLSGSWRVAVNRSDTNESLAFFSTGGDTGDFTFSRTISGASNAYTGSVYFRVTSESVAGTIYCDNFVFQRNSLPGESGWYSDSDAIAEYGRREEILFRGAMTSQTAADESKRYVVKNARPLPMPPSSLSIAARLPVDSMTITYAGYWGLFNWRYTTASGTKTRAQWIASLAATNPFITVGAVFNNTRDFVVDNRGPIRVGDVMKNVILAGDDAGTFYSGQVDKRTFSYQPISNDIAYYFKNNRLTAALTDELMPALVRPGWMLWQDMPWRSGRSTRLADDVLRKVFIEEVELLPPTADFPDGELSFNLEVN